MGWAASGLPPETEKSIHGHVRLPLAVPVRPAHADLVDAVHSPESKVEAGVVRHQVAAAAPHHLPLDSPPGPHSPPRAVAAGDGAPAVTDHRQPMSASA